MASLRGSLAPCVSIQGVFQHGSRKYAAHDDAQRHRFSEWSEDMKRVVLEVGDMLSVLDFAAVEKQLRRMPGVQGATVNIASNTAVVDYDENTTNVEALRGKILECGFECCGEVLPRHVC